MMDNKRRLKERILSIEGFRFLLIFYIVLFHYTYRYDEIFGSLGSLYFFKFGGLVGNCLFFLMSGFFLNRFLIGNNGDLKDVLKYIINRYWRLWPIYAVAVIIIFITSRFLPLPNKIVDIRTGIVNVLFIYHPKFDYVDGAHWFIAALLLFQLIFGITIILRKDCKRAFVKMTIIYPLAIYLLHAFNIITFSEYYYNLACPYFLSFYLGMIICDFVDQSRSVYNCVWLLFTELFWIVNTQNIVIITFQIIFIFLLLNRNHFVNRLFGNRILVYLGGVSYSWYLIHQNIGYTILYYFDNMINNKNLLVVASLLLTVIIAILLNELVSLLPKQLIK